MTTPAEALRLLRAPDQRHQGRAHTPDVGEVTAERLAAVERFAVAVRVWHPALIPGLLQTTRYAATAIATARPAFPSTDTQRYAHQRAARVDQFMVRWQHPDVDEAVFIVAEQAVTRPLVHTRAHRAQLRQLLNLSALPKIRLHVLPHDRQAAGRAGHASLYALEPAEPGRGKGVRVAYTETPLGGWYSTRPEDVARLHTSFAEIIEAALDPADTRTLIRKALTA